MHSFGVCEAYLKVCTKFGSLLYEIFSHKALNYLSLSPQIKLCVNVEIVFVQHHLYFNRQSKEKSARGRASVYEMVQAVV